MRKREAGVIVIILCLGAFVAVGQLSTWFHQDITTVSGASGTIDWATGWIQVEGYGYPSITALSESQGTQLARDAAIADAQWRLLEIIKSVSVSGAATVVDHMASSAVRTEVEGTIQNFQIIDEEWNVPPKTFLFFFKRKGDWQDGEYKVTLIYNKDQLLLTFIPEIQQVFPQEEETGDVLAPTPYTGVVFDALGYGVDLNPSIFVSIVDTQGTPVFDAVAASYVPSAGYRLGIPTSTLTTALEDPRVGLNPLRVVVQGTALDGFALVVSQTDAELIARIAATSNILTRGAGSVLIVAE